MQARPCDVIINGDIEVHYVRLAEVHVLYVYIKVYVNNACVLTLRH